MSNRRNRKLARRIARKSDSQRRQLQLEHVRLLAAKDEHDNNMREGRSCHCLNCKRAAVSLAY